MVWHPCGSLVTVTHAHHYAWLMCALHGLFNRSQLTQYGHDKLCFCSAGSEATDACSSIIPDIMPEYVEVKREFVSACTREGTPTLEEVKDFCIDLIECASKTVPRISRKEDDIEKAVTFTELARVVCFRLSKWVSYDFFKKVIARFQPALKSVQDQLMRYESQLKLFLEQKLECIAELQQR